MLAFRLAVVVIGILVTSTSAFYQYNPDHPTVKHDHVVSVGDYISKGFAFTGPDAPQQLANTLHRISISRRALPANTNPARQATLDIRRLRSRISVKDHILDQDLERRVNGYKIVPGTTPTVPNSAAIDQDGTDYSYFAEVQLGSNAKTLYMLLDTGASNTWVMGPDCTSPACSTHLSYGPNDSTSLVESSNAFTIGYGTGDVSGHVITDTFTMAGMTVTLTFGSASTVSDNFANWPMDGLLGLGRFNSSVMQGNSYIQAITNLKTLPTVLFGVSLSRTADGTTDGEIAFGAPDPAKFRGSISYSPMEPGQQGWEVPVDDMAVAGKPLGLTGNQAFIDTGTTYMLIPASDAQTLFGQVPGSVNSGDYWNIPCDTTIEIAVVFQGVSFNISPEDYVGDPQGNNLCQSHIIGHAALGDNQWLLGDTFMKNVYTVFDADQARIGFATRNDALASPGPPAAPPGSPSSTLAPSASSSSMSAAGPSGHSASSSAPALNVGVVPLAGSSTQSGVSSSPTMAAQAESATPATSRAERLSIFGGFVGIMGLTLTVVLAA